MRNRTCVGVFLMWLGIAPDAAAATFTVTTTADEVDLVPGDGLCLTANNVCSLRAAIQETNALASSDQILLPAGIYTLTLPELVPGPNNVDPEHGDLDITDSLDIQGDGAASTIIQASATMGTAVVRVFDVTLPGPVVANIHDVTIRFGNALPAGGPSACDGGGGGLANRRDANNLAGATTLWDSVVTGNTASHSGGGLCNESPGAISILRTSVSGNNAAGEGGGIANSGQPGAIFVIVSSVSGNHANFSGGGIANLASGRAEIIDSTISGNISGGEGGGLFNGVGSNGEFRNATVVGNSAATVGGVISADVGAISVRHTIIAANQSPTFPDCHGLSSLGHNVIGAGFDIFLHPYCVLFPQPSDQIGTDVAPLDAGIGPLLYNGGPTETHALLAGSPAIDAGDPAVGCTDKFGTPLPDQRGLPRPLTQCDVGAYEAQQVLGTAMATVPSSTGAGPVTFATSAGTFGSLDPVSEADLPQDGKPPVPFPFGFFSWTVTGLTLGETITVTITYPAPVAAPAAHWKVVGGVWMDATSFLGSDDGDNVLTLTVTDGLFPDADGLVNGQISDPGGLSPSPGSEILPFAAFKARIHVDRRKARLHFEFQLHADSNGIDPQHEDAVITVGDESLTIPAGAYALHRRGDRFVLIAAISGMPLTGGETVPVTLTIGDDSGNGIVRIKGRKSK